MGTRLYRSNTLLRHSGNSFLFDMRPIDHNIFLKISRNRRGRNEQIVLVLSDTSFDFSLFTSHFSLISFLPIGEKQIQINHEKKHLRKKPIRQISCALKQRRKFGTRTRASGRLCPASAPADPSPVFLHPLTQGLLLQPHTLAGPTGIEPAQT